MKNFTNFLRIMESAPRSHCLVRLEDPALVPIADSNALEEAADELLAREAEAVLAEGWPTVTMAELLADLFSERGDGTA